MKKLVLFSLFVFCVQVVMAQSKMDDKLWSAVRDKSLSKAQKSIEKGANVNFTRYETSPLIRAIEDMNIEMVKLLLENGANISHKVRRSVFFGHEAEINALFCYIRKSTFNDEGGILKLLVDHGAQVDAPEGPNQMTPLVFAILSDKGQIVEELLKNGANPNARSVFDGATPLASAVDYSTSGTSESARERKREVVKTLIEYGADFSEMNSEELTALKEKFRSHMSHVKKSYQLVEEMVEARLEEIAFDATQGDDGKADYRPYLSTYLKGYLRGEPYYDRYYKHVIDALFNEASMRNDLRSIAQFVGIFDFNDEYRTVINNYDEHCKYAAVRTSDFKELLPSKINESYTRSDLNYVLEALPNSSIAEQARQGLSRLDSYLKSAKTFTFTGDSPDHLSNADEVRFFDKSVPDDIRTKIITKSNLAVISLYTHYDQTFNGFVAQKRESEPSEVHKSWLSMAQMPETIPGKEGMWLAVGAQPDFILVSGVIYVIMRDQDWISKEVSYEACWSEGMRFWTEHQGYFEYSGGQWKAVD